MKRWFRIILWIVLILLFLVVLILILSYKQVWIDDSWCPKWTSLADMPPKNFVDDRIKPWVTSCSDCALTKEQYELWGNPVYTDECEEIKKTCYVCFKSPSPWCTCTAELLDIKVNNLTWYLLRTVFLHIIPWRKSFYIKLAYLIA